MKIPTPPHVLADRAADEELRPWAVEAAVRALGLVAALVGLVAAFAFGFSLIFGAAGCATRPPFDEAAIPLFAPDGTNQVRRAALVVTVSRVDPKKWRGWDGKSLGVDVDAQIVKMALEAQGVPYLSLSDEEATVAGTLAAAEAVGRRVAPGGLLMLYYSGHGGQEPDFYGQEFDGADETLCLYDGALSDNVVWQMLCRVPDGVRVWMVTDCCNSGSNFREAPRPHDYAGGVARWWRSEPSLLHFGAARDGTSALGARKGGLFTLALLDTWKEGITYRDWFEAAAERVADKQTPVLSSTGKPFENMEAWR